MSADDVLGSPLAFSGQRLDWRDLPRAVRSRIAELAGAQVTAEISANTGFSPGFAAALELADGRGVFVKAVSPEQNPASPDLARAEIRVAAALPPEVPAPKMLWSDDDGEWVLLGFEVVHGRAPESPWRPADLELALDALAVLADAEPLPGHQLPSTDVTLAAEFTGWRQLHAAAPEVRREAAEQAGELGGWAWENLEQLVRWEQESPRVSVGGALVHGDLRADNMLIDHEHAKIALVDWPHASVGAPWLDLAFMLPSVSMQGGGDPQDLFWSQPVTDGLPVDHLRAALAGMSGRLAYGSLQPAPQGIPNLRRFQRAQAEAALSWLRELA